MSMILEVHGARDETIARLLEDPPLIWQLVAPDAPEFYEQARARSARSGGGILDRLFIRRPSPPSDAVVPPLALGESEGSHVDIDKAWHGLHYLLTGTAWSGEPPLDFLVAGGRTIGDEEVGYGPGRAFLAAEVAAIAEAFERVSDAELGSRFDAADMMTKEIYPEIWDRDPAEDDTLEYLMAHLRTLREAVSSLKGRGMGMVLTLT